MKIRNAAFLDAEGIAKVHVDSWRSTYRHIIPDVYLNQLSYELRTSLWRKNISMKGNHVFVAVNDDGEIVGFADCGKRNSNNIPNSSDLTSIYLLEKYQGKGFGKQLLKKIFIQFERLGFDRVFVEVLAENNTRYFYEHYGATLHGTEKVTIAGAELDLLVYEWKNVNDVLSKF